ncbi:MAG: AAA family ATPase [Lachnospiraceae bacterium]|nr:AAA family ATPase [Lachnospiraceae bacterium]
MLMRFSVSNYMSFGYKEDSEGNICADEFYLYAGSSQQFKDRVINFQNRNVLKFSSIYGANAAGKSNLIHAVSCGKHIILGTMEQDFLRDKYCRSREVNKELPTLFEYEFTIGEKCYAYGFTVNLWEQKVLSEWLYELQGSKEFTIFERIVEQNKYYFDEEIFSDNDNIQEFHYYLKDANRVSSSLLLYELNRRNLENDDFEIFHQIFNWFDKKLVIIFPKTKIGASYFRFEDNNESLVEILKYLDTGITNYQMQKINETAFKEYFSDETLAERFLKRHNNEGERKIRGVLHYKDALFELDYGEKGETNISKLLFKHGNDETSYEYGEESDGTQRIVELLDIILNDDKEKVFIIDELDRSLHPKMTIKFVETFLNFSKNTNTQLIITTHESNLMDLDILRRDEIWFAEREKDNTTTLYTLEKFKVRYDKVVSKDYLSGRYGAVPIFKDFDYVWGDN